MEILIRNLNLLINGGDSQNANIVSVDTAFPANISNTIPVDMHIFPSSFYLDVTNDSKKDLIITTNMQNNSENKSSCWLYENHANNLNPEFHFVTYDYGQLRALVGHIPTTKNSEGHWPHSVLSVDHFCEQWLIKKK